MSNLTINKYSDNKIKNILIRKLTKLNSSEKEVAEDFIEYPRLNFQNTETIATILNVSTSELFEKKEISAETLNYRNKKHNSFNAQIDDLLQLIGEIDKQYKYYGDNHGEE
ncbi:hypothetical protein K4R20_03775 [Staphylococcus epidermidis]|uniref:hypothetical protein n=1 Tax=Staphylococcus epidermidis TaxID=1282 RepID=UPI002857CB8D|nr:hypothetical protein [Staphylococcus epidermidis]MCG1061591.1 hypothetical protein [Staphylococcus epidermidis]MCG2096481.1 hypothetical protein [Staphylococcus epidermidis]MCG2217245.1 hypothetical protein [Staphylococcus epidermidis]MDR6745681.1 hypothetical protein [Staphylococcus epidermidis]